jgi:hypothetical protein
MEAVRSLHKTPVLLSLFQLTDDWTSGSFVLTPRSKEACEIEGILQEELCLLPRENFFEKNVPDFICHIRWNHYNDKRRTKIKMLQEAYKCQVLNSDLEAPPNQRKHIQSKSVFDLDGSLQGSTEDTVRCMKWQKEALAKRHKQNITKLLLHEFYWQLKFEENQKVRPVWDENSQNLPSMSLSSTANRHRKEQIMLTNRREAERAQRASEMRSVSEALQEDREKEVCYESLSFKVLNIFMKSNRGSMKRTKNS